MAKSGQRGTTPVRRSTGGPARGNTAGSARGGPAKGGPAGGKSAGAKSKPRSKGKASGKSSGAPKSSSRASAARSSKTARSATHRAKRQAGNIGGDQVEGRQAVRELLLAGKRDVREVFLVAGQDPAPILNDIIDLADEAKIPIRQVSRSRFETMSRTEAPQGVVALAAPLRPVPLEELAQRPTASPSASPSTSQADPKTADADSHPATKPFIVVVDSVVDPHNLGALMRSAEAAGVTGFVFSRHRSPRISPTVTKVAAGAVEHLPIAQANGIAGALRDLAKLGVWNIGLDAGAERPVWSMNLADEPLALVLGSEEKGLSRLVRESCDLLVNIPISGVTPSLNVSAAGAIACFEVKRQREKL